MGADRARLLHTRLGALVFGADDDRHRPGQLNRDAHASEEYLRARHVEVGRYQISSSPWPSAACLTTDQAKPEQSAARCIDCAVLLARGGVDRNEALRAAKMVSGGTATKVIELVESGFVTGSAPLWRKQREALHWLADEYSLFYLTWRSSPSAGSARGPGSRSASVHGFARGAGSRSRISPTAPPAPTAFEPLELLSYWR